jgi:hypothetical protein
MGSPGQLKLRYCKYHGARWCYWVGRNTTQAVKPSDLMGLSLPSKSSDRLKQVKRPRNEGATLGEQGTCKKAKAKSEQLNPINFGML